MRISHATNRGPRDNLEDRAAALQVVDPIGNNAALVLQMFDGVGGRRYGEIAAETAKQHLSAMLPGIAAQLLLGGCDVSVDSVLDALCQAFTSANKAIIELADRYPAYRGMSTTGGCALMSGGLLYVAWAGDSRCCVYGGTGLRRVTRDHSQVQELIDLDLFEPLELVDHPLSHTITRYLGQRNGFEPDTRLVRVSPGDLVILCSDGLTDVLPDTAIAGMVHSLERSGNGVEGLAQALVDEALRQGTRDNVTVLCGQYQSNVSKIRDSTATGAYPVRLAESLCSVEKESRNV